MSEHTPTPWTHDAMLNHGERVLLAGDDEIALIYASNGMDEPTDYPAMANAAFIVKAVNSHDALEAVRKAAYDYFMCAVQDEADDEEYCVTEEQHKLAKALRDALLTGIDVGTSSPQDSSSRE